MQILSSSTEKMFVPVTPPDGVDLTTVGVSVALRLETLDGEPATGDYLTASWVNGEAMVLVSTGEFPAGQYNVYVRLVSAPEDIRKLAGRVRIGDARV